MNMTDLAQLRELMAACAEQARRDGIWTLKDRPDVPPFFIQLLALMRQEFDKGGNAQRIQTMLLGMRLISEGNTPEIVREVLAVKCGCGDFYHLALYAHPRRSKKKTAIAGAHSVYRFIERTAERVSNGVRWETIDYENNPHYHYNVFNGCGGISLFLAEYYGVTGSATALDLAIGANQWCSWREHEGPSRGLLVGRTGVAMSWLHLSQIAQKPEYMSYCVENAKILLREDPGPFTDLMGGAASNGLFLIRLWQATNDRKYLNGAVRCGEWLRENLVRDERGCHCLARPDGEFGDVPFLGVAHGIAGVAHYFLLLHDWALNKLLPCT